jgi:hypothetical protein
MSWNGLKTSRELVYNPRQGGKTRLLGLQDIIETDRSWSDARWDSSAYNNYGEDDLMSDRLMLGDGGKKHYVTMRMVSVYIVDTDPRLPLSEAMLFQSEAPFLTDETDPEIIQHLDTDKILAHHNKKREKIVDVEATRTSEVVIYLPGDRTLKEVKVVVTTHANFPR